MLLPPLWLLGICCQLGLHFSFGGSWRSGRALREDGSLSGHL
jgi:hypothetical protein